VFSLVVVVVVLVQHHPSMIDINTVVIRKSFFMLYSGKNKISYNSIWSFRLGISQVNPISSSLDLNVICAFHSPWIMNVFFGAFVKPFARLNN
jgi:hypothetical protein